MGTSFEDHFSEKASTYALYRPHYPPELFTYLASLAPGRRLAWDCGTGNGQAARELVNLFDRVIATDASAEQLSNAFPHERIIYRVEPAEDVSLETRSVDLITVATAVHWFELRHFYQTVRRVSVAGGILAVWAYHLPVIEPAIEQVLFRFYREVLAGYWPERFHYVAERYQTLPFPFEKLRPPEFQMKAEWDLYQLAGFMDSWSGSQRYRAAQDQLPSRLIWPELLEAWGDPDRRRMIRWPLYLRVGQVW
jgi:hypothetical protein